VQQYQQRRDEFKAHSVPWQAVKDIWKALID